MSLPALIKKYEKRAAEFAYPPPVYLYFIEDLKKAQSEEIERARTRFITVSLILVYFVAILICVFFTYNYDNKRPLSPSNVEALDPTEVDGFQRSNDRNDKQGL